MKIILSLAIVLLVAFNVDAQDTLKKVIEYDLTIEAAGKTTIPWLQNYVKTAEKRPWLETLLDDFESGKLVGYEGKLNNPINPATYIFEVDPSPDTVYVVDPITLEEKFEIVYATSLKQKNIQAIRVIEE